MRKKLERVKSYMTIMLLVACQNGPNKANSPASKKPTETHKTPKKEEKVCRNKNLLKILEDGRTIFSMIETEGRSSYVLWDVFSQKIKRKISMALDIVDISKSGEFFVDRMNLSRFKVLSVEDQDVKYSETLIFRKGKKPDAKFSMGGRHLFLKHTVDYKTYAFNIFDLYKREFVYSNILKNSQNYFLNDHENLYVFNSVDALRNLVRHINLSTGEEDLVWLRQGKISFTGISKNRIIAKINNIFYSYPINNWGHNLILEIKKILDIDDLSNKAFVKANNDKFGIMDLDTGEMLHTVENTEDELNESCRLSGGAESLVCPSLNNGQSVKLYNLKNGTNSEVCL